MNNDLCYFSLQPVCMCENKSARATIRMINKYLRVIRMLPSFLPSFLNPVAKFLVSDGRDIVDSGIGLSYRPATQHRLESRYDNSMPESTKSPQSGIKNLASDDHHNYLHKYSKRSLGINYS